MIKEDNDILNSEASKGDDGEKPDDRKGPDTNNHNPTKVQDLAKAGRDDFDSNAGQE